MHTHAATCLQEAVDIDSVAVNATMANLELNSCSKCCSAHLALPACSDADPLAKHRHASHTYDGYDVVLANILKPALLDLRPRLTRYVREGGTLLLAGILERQVDEVRQAYSGEFEWQAPRIDSDWALLVGTKKS